MKATRKQYAVRICAADGCHNKVKPTRKGHRYCSDTCATYMRQKRYREAMK